MMYDNKRNKGTRSKNIIKKIAKVKTIVYLYERSSNNTNMT